MTIISLADAKQQLRIAQSDTSQDSEIQLFVMALDDVIERETGKAVSQRAEVDQYYSINGTVWLRPRPVISVTSVASVDGSTTWTVGNLNLHNRWGRLTALTGPRLCGDLLIAHVAGITSTSPSWRLAGRMILQANYETVRGQMGAPRFGGQDQVPSDWLIPRKAKQLLGLRPPTVA